MPLTTRKLAIPARVAGWLQPQDFLFLSDARTGKQMIDAAARAIAATCGLQATPVFDALWRREQAGSTALGHGFAIPHARITGIPAPSTLYVRTSEPIPFGAPDGDPVSDFLVILVPPDGGDDDHLQLLAAISHLLSDRRFRAALHAAATGDVADAAFRSAIARLVMAAA